MQENRPNIIQTVREYSQRLFRFIRSRVSTDEDAEDILQDVWYQFSNTAETEVINQVSGWLHRVARNKITDRSVPFGPPPGGGGFARHSGGQHWREKWKQMSPEERARVKDKWKNWWNEKCDPPA